MSRPAKNFIPMAHIADDVVNEGFVFTLSVSGASERREPNITTPTIIYRGKTNPRDLTDEEVDYITSTVLHNLVSIRERYARKNYRKKYEL